MVYVMEDEHDGQGWFYPLGKVKMYKDEAKDFVQRQHYAYLRDQRELGYYYPEPEFRLIPA